MIPHIYRATIWRVVDGNTVDALIDLGFHITTTRRLRLVNTYAPDGDSNSVAAMFLAERIEGKDVIVETDRGDAFDDWRVSIFYQDQNINKLMWSEGLAQPVNPGDTQ